MARIVEDDSPVLSVGEAAAESAGAVVLEVTLSTSGSVDAAVDYATSDDTADIGLRRDRDAVDVERRDCHSGCRPFGPRPDMRAAKCDP